MLFWLEAGKETTRNYIAAVFKGAFFPAKNFISFIHKF
jgi:hypothetical protein